MGRFLGGRFGSIVPISPNAIAPSAVYSMPDQYYAKRDGSWILARGITATGGAIQDYTVGNTSYRAHVFTGSGSFAVTDLGTYGGTIEYLVVAGGGSGGEDGGGGGGGGGGSSSALAMI